MAEETDHPLAEIDCRAIVRRFGGPTNLYRRLVRRGHNLSPKTVEKWAERARMGTPWLAELIVMAQEDGYPIHLMDYITTPQGAGDSEQQEEMALPEDDEEDGLI